ncbi:MAG: hypothetical protein GXO15_02315 [Crenarchaeota archaeon]|nr:hypothetical protein [Thermoproteota archaeon]
MAGDVPLRDPRQAARVYGELLERFLFKHLLQELRRIVGERAAAGLVFRIVKMSMREAVEEVLPKGMVSDPMSAMRLCYTLFAMAGQEFSYEEDPGAHVFKVYRCPHYRFTGSDPVACVACAATKAGALEALTGRSVAVVLEDGTRLGPRDAEIIVRRLTHMPSGDKYCTFKLEVRGEPD